MPSTTIKLMLFLSKHCGVMGDNVRPIEANLCLNETDITWMDSFEGRLDL